MTRAPQHIPETIGRYRIERLIARGGMGAVYKAIDDKLDRTVALKTVKPGASDPVFLDRLHREARACGRLRHPNIVTVYDLGETDGLVFIAMEHLEGLSLADAIETGTLTFEAKLRVLIQVLDALHYAHGEGVIHRDIKPTNIQVLPDRTVKLLDFGIARVARADSLTVTGDVMGTPFYMAPEQLKGQVVDHRADIFSVGAVAYELLTHRKAFEGNALTEVMLKVLQDDPPPMSTGWSDAFPELEGIVGTALAKSADARYATAEDMQHALTAFMAGSQAAINRRQVEATVLAGRTVAEAQALIANGRIRESQDLIAATLRSIPEAGDLRHLYAETLSSVARDVPVVHPPAVRSGPRQPTPSRDVPAPERTVGSPRARGPLVLWGAPLAALVVLSIVAVVVARQWSESDPSSKETAIIQTERATPPAVIPAPRNSTDSFELEPQPLPVDSVPARGATPAVAPAATSIPDRRDPSTPVGPSGDTGTTSIAPATFVQPTSARTIATESGSIQSASFDRTSRMLVTGHRGGTIKVWDVDRGTLVRGLSGFEGSVNAIAFGRDGRIAAARGDDTVAIVDSSTGNASPRLVGHAGPVNSIAWTADGRQLITGSEDSTIRLWDSATGREVMTFTGHRESVMAIALAQLAGVVASASRDGSARLWDVQTGRERLTVNTGQALVSVAIDRNGQHLAAGSDGGTMFIWATGTSGSGLSVKAHDGAVWSLAFTNDGRVTSTGADGRLRVWSAENGSRLEDLDGPGGWLRGLAVSGDGQWMAAGGASGALRVWRRSAR